jgi:hypothetical protein
MNFCRAKTVHLFLAVLFTLAWAAPACAGGEGCAMPCCRTKAKPDPPHAAMPCCAQPTQTGRVMDSDCASAQVQVLQSVLPDVRPAGDAIALASVPSAPVLPASLPAVPPARSGPPFDTPLYLRTLSLLI